LEEHPQINQNNGHMNMNPNPNGEVPGERDSRQFVGGMFHISQSQDGDCVFKGTPVLGQKMDEPEHVRQIIDYQMSQMNMQREQYMNNNNDNNPGE